MAGGSVYICGITAGTGGGGGTFSHTFDFTLGTQGWTLVGAGWGTHDGANGWRNEFTDTLFTYVSAALYIEITCPSIEISSVDINYSYTEELGTTWGHIQAGLNGGLEIADNLVNGSHTFTQNFTTPNTSTSIRALIDVRRSGSIGSPGNCWITSIVVHGSGSDPFTYNTNVAYSSDFGASFASPQQPTASLVLDSGFDTERIGIPTLLASVGQVQMATTAGGAYADYGSAFADGDFAANMLYTPRFQFNSDTTNNAGTNTPQYVVACEIPTASNHSIYRVTSSGTVFSDLTPVNGGVYGGIAGPDAFDMPFKSGKRMAAIFDFSGTRHLYVSTNAGTAWTDRGAIDAAASMVRYRRGDRTLGQLFIANGASGILVSNDHGATLLSKSIPTTDAILGIVPF